ncbi:Ubiquinol oxidase [Astathelohania contejeani]|uniref:Alternative oxidase n=1 Tax=Astathelohania contejeani TaxID=164912 RepID=A0ABQ7HZL5_9MICR|nr:Ubiquinol oxidase [Thelohania contejeani]
MKYPQLYTSKPIITSGYSQPAFLKTSNLSIPKNHLQSVGISHIKRFFPQKEKLTLEKLAKIDYRNGYHFKPQTTGDAISHRLVKFLRSFADFYFQKDYLRRVIVLETVAAIPGLVGGMFRHLYSLRNMVDNGETIKALLEEAENERQHLLTFIEIGKPSFLDRVMIRFGQYVFFNWYMLFYMLFPRVAHRFVGYLEEEAIHSYNGFEEEILNGNIENVPAPQIAIDYWKLPSNSRLIDVVRAVRLDEAHHRDTNHRFANNKPFTLEK